MIKSHCEILTPVFKYNIKATILLLLRAALNIERPFILPLRERFILLANIVIVLDYRS